MKRLGGAEGAAKIIMNLDDLERELVRTDEERKESLEQELEGTN